MRVGTRLLPLLFVSPDQINAMLPSDLSDGEYILATRNGSLPELEGKFTVVRSAPGVFGETIGEQFIVTAQREDGSLASPDRPARRGEKVTLLGTGFGPYQRSMLDGFAVPDNPPNPLRDIVEIVAGGAVVIPEFAGAAPGTAGLSAVRFTVPPDWPAGQAMDLRVRVNGKESNSAILPLD